MSKRLMRPFVTLMLSALLALSVTGIAAAQYPPPPGLQVAEAALEATVCAENADVIVCTTGVIPAGVVVEGSLTFVLADGGTVEVGDTETGADAPVTLAFAIPANATEVAGIQLRATGAEGNVVTASPEAAIAPIADLQAPDQAGLPTTGGQFTVGMALAVTVLVLGAGLLLVARRRSGADVSGSER